MYLEDMISNIRIELGDRDSTVWTSDDEVTRAIEKAVSLMSRLTPKRDLIETTIVRDIDDETLTISSSTGTLAYKPIKPGSVVMTGKTLDTDYRIDYLTGIVTEIGSNLTDTDYTVSYELDPYILDLSSLLPDYIRLERVEYPVGDVPLSLLTFDVFGSSLVIRGSGTTLSENDHLRVIYLKKWTPPTAEVEGDYPSHLDDIVIIGSAGQALIFKAVEYTHTVITNLDSAVTALGAISAVTFPSAPDIASYITDADTALDAAVARFTAAVTTLGSMDTPLADTNTALDQIDTELTAAIAFLTSGSSLINVATRGEDVGKIFGEYAGHRVDISEGYEKEASQRIALALAYEADAARDTTIGNSYVNEAIQRLAMAARLVDKYASEVSSAGHEVTYYRSQVDKATQYGTVASQYLEAAGRYLADGQSKINEFLAALGITPEFSKQKASHAQTPF